MIDIREYISPSGFYVNGPNSFFNKYRHADLLGTYKPCNNI